MISLPKHEQNETTYKLDKMIYGRRLDWTRWQINKF